MNAPFFDTLQNFLSGLGLARDKGSSYASMYSLIELQQPQLEMAFRGDWIARKIVTIPAFDSTREWRRWLASDKQIEQLEETEREWNIRGKIQELLIKSRLYGGAALIIGLDEGQEKELNLERVGKDALKFLHVVNRHQLSHGQLVDDILSPYYGEPEYWQRQTNDPSLQLAKIHPSRVIRMVGNEKPDRIAANEVWGDSVLQVVDDAIKAAGLVGGSIAALIAEAKFDIIKIPNMTSIVATAEGRERLTNRFAYANANKSIINTVVLDKEEEWDRVSVAFAGMPDILQMYLLIAAGAADIPVTRLLGQSPAGLNATGESDIRNYYDRLHADQEMKLRPTLEQLDEIIIRTTLGKRDENIWYEWNPLWQMSEVEKADNATKYANVTKIDNELGLIPFTALVKARQNQLIEAGVYPGLEEALEEAEAEGDVVEKPPTPEEMMAEQAKQVNAQQGQLPSPFDSAAEASHDSRPFATYGEDAGFAGAALAKWEEALHPRVKGSAEGGQFTTKPKPATQPGAQRSPALSKLFVSPNVANIGLAEAVNELDGERQKALLAASRHIDKVLGINGSNSRSAIGAWTDGAENSMMVSMPDVDYPTALLAAAMKGHLADQKQVLLFRPDAKGADYMAALEIDIDRHGQIPGDGRGPFQSIELRNC